MTIVVIQCAAKKKPDAGHLRGRDGKRIMFVGDPGSAPADVASTFAKPDDVSDTGVSWRDRLVKYNENPGNNALNLLPAWQLYENKTYERLVEKFGIGNVYILSAGWGLIAADFLTPTYDITFSPSAEKWKRRKRKDRYEDFHMLPPDTTQPVVFFGGKYYAPLFCSLTEGVKGPRILFYSLATAPIVPNCVLRKFNSTNKRKWPYECANAFIEGKIR